MTFAPLNPWRAWYCVEQTTVGRDRTPLFELRRNRHLPDRTGARGLHAS